jgi:hypothetical protein
VVKITFVEQGASDYATGERHGALRRADPCDIGRGSVAEEIDLVKSLKFAVCACDTSMKGQNSCNARYMMLLAMCSSK